MCRLYAMHATEPRRVACGLVRSQDAPMARSTGDSEGLVHGHGRGVADDPDGIPVVEKRVRAAVHGAHFAKKAARVYARTVVAHVRRATVGATSIEKTHPIHHGNWIFAHNPTLPNFERTRFAMLDAMDPLRRSGIDGETDGERIFRDLPSLILHHPEHGLLENALRGLRRVVRWCREVDPDARIGLNVVPADGQEMARTRLNRSLWCRRRDAVFVCPVCKLSPVHHEARVDCRVFEFASEPITVEEDRVEVPNGTVFRLADGCEIEERRLEPDMVPAR